MASSKHFLDLSAMTSGDLRSILEDAKSRKQATKAGTADNVVPASATIAVDVRCVIPEEKDRLEAEMSRLTATLAGARVEVSGGMNRPPMHESMTTELFAIAQKVADDYGITGLRGVAVGGGSDGNLTAAVGVRTLDGLGAVGAGAGTTGDRLGRAVREKTGCAVPRRCGAGAGFPAGPLRATTVRYG